MAIYGDRCIASSVAAAVLAWLLSLYLPQIRPQLIRRKRWMSHQTVADIAAQRQPVVLTASPAAAWRAVHRWTPEFLAAKWPASMVHGVWESAQPVFVYSAERGELGGRTEMVAPAADVPSVIARELSPAAFFLGDNRTFRYWQDELGMLGDALAADIIGGGTSPEQLSVYEGASLHIEVAWHSAPENLVGSRRDRGEMSLSAPVLTVLAHARFRLERTGRRARVAGRGWRRDSLPL